MRIRWARYVTRIGWIGNTYKILVEKPESKGQFRRNRHGWEDVFKIIHC